MSEACYNLEWEKVIEQLKSSEKGLAKQEVEKRLSEFGRNKLIEKNKFSLLKLIISQFTEFLIVILIIAAVISYWLGDFLDAYAIIAIVILNAILGVWQEFKAEKAMEALKKMTALNATVLRGGHVQQIDSELLVPGDIVLLEAGSKVPADLRLIEAVNLKIDEAALTGESTAVEKETEAINGKAALANQKNSAFANTVVTYGRGKGIVTQTGMKTEFGKIAGTLESIAEEPTPLKVKLEILAKQLGILFVIIVVILFIVGVFMGRDVFEMFETSVALAVAAIPEGLPAIITITLALGTLQMARNNAIVRRMPAVEALGSATVICSDKTGTLTRNEMFVEKVYANNKLYEVSGKGYAPEGEFKFENKKIEIENHLELKKLLEIAVHCNDATLEEDGGWKLIGDPTEGALITMAWKANIKAALKRIDEIPFDSERKMMTTLHKEDGNVKLSLTESRIPKEAGKLIAFSKGAPKKILDLCNYIYENGNIAELDEKKKKELFEISNNLASDAYRILGFAFKNVGGNYDKTKLENEIIFVGLAAMRDPPRKGIEDAVKTCYTAGINIKIITGDNALTASAIGRKIDLINVETISGEELDTLDETKFIEAVKRNGIFARVSPEHKFRIVSVLKEAGEIVAVTGDGVNDAPALKKADIGVAMGIKGTDVAKEASGLVLRDDYFGTIVVAVKEGRRIYSNIRAFVKYLLAANFGEIAVIVTTTLASLPQPLLPLQILWINLVTDSLPALALGKEKAASGIMETTPRKPKENVLHNMRIFVVAAALLGLTATMVAYFWGFGFDAAKGINEFDFSQASEAKTMAFTTIVMFELMLVFSCRIDGKTIFELNPFSNKTLLAAVGTSIALQLAVVYHPFMQTIFKTVPLSLTDLGVIVALSSTSILVPYVERLLTKNRK